MFATLIDAFNVQQGKILISWMRGRHLDMLIILCVILMSLAFHLYVVVYHFCVF